MQIFCPEMSIFVDFFFFWQYFFVDFFLDTIGVFFFK